MDWLLAALGAMVVLACPLMMIACVFGMRRMKGGAENTATATPEQTIADLEQQLRAMRIELSNLRTQSEQVAAGAEPGAVSVSGAGHGAQRPA